MKQPPKPKSGMMLPALVKHANFFKKIAKKDAQIKARKLEKERRDLAKEVRKLEVVYKKMQEFEGIDLTDKTDEEVADIQNEKAKLMTFFQVVSMFLLAKSNLHLADYLCVQIPDAKLKRKNPETGKIEEKKGVVRFTMGDMLYYLNDLIEGFDDDDGGGIDGRLETLVSMVNDIGIAHKAFRDENGLEVPEKYLGKEKSNKVSVESEEVLEEYGTTEEEQQEIDDATIDEIPDLRIKEKKNG